MINNSHESLVPIRIQEIFGPTIQGEGVNAGKLCYFIRLNGCDQKPICSWCDTVNAYKENISSFQSIHQTIEQIRLLNSKFKDVCVNRFVITGGNPCIQDCTDLIKKLRKNFTYNAICEIDVETQGTVFPDWLKFVDLITISPKPPSSNIDGVGQDIDRMLEWCSNRRGSYNDDFSKLQLKIVVFNENDAIYALDCIKRVNKSLIIEDMNNISYCLQLGTDRNNVERSFSANDLIKYLQDNPDKISREIMNNLRILPQIHNILNVE